MPPAPPAPISTTTALTTGSPPAVSITINGSSVVSAGALATPSSGVVFANNSMVFDGQSGEYVCVAATPGTRAASFALWVVYETLPAPGTNLLRVTNGTSCAAQNAPYVVLSVMATAGGAIAYNATPASSTGAVLNVGRWHLLVVTAVDGDDIALVYEDGALIGSTPMYGPAPTAFSFLLGTSGNSAESFDGAIAAFQSYAYALSSPQVADLYEDGPPSSTGGKNALTTMSLIVGGAIGGFFLLASVVSVGLRAAGALTVSRAAAQEAAQEFRDMKL